MLFRKRIIEGNRKAERELDRVDAHWSRRRRGSEPRPDGDLEGGGGTPVAQEERLHEEDLDLVTRSAVAIWNQSLRHNEDSAVYGPMLQDLARATEGRQILLSVCEEDTEDVIANYVLLYEDNMFHLVSLCLEQPTVVWRVRRDYLESTLLNPQKYIESPHKLDWQWVGDCS